MKRILSLLLAFILVLGLCACNKPSDTPLPTEDIVPTTPESPTETEPVAEENENNEENEKLKEAKESALKDVLMNQSYTLNASAVRATLIKEYYIAQLAAVHGEDGKLLYSVSGFVDNVMTEYILGQDDQGNIYFYEQFVAETTTKNWYQCTNTEQFDITQNLFDLSFFVEALNQADSVEYIDSDADDDHFIVYSNIKAEHQEETDAQIVFDVFVNSLNEITSIHYYADDTEWIIMFVSPDQANLYIPEGTELGKIDAVDAQKLISDAHIAVQTPPVFEEEPGHEEEDPNHSHEENIDEEPILDSANGYKEILKNKEYVINWENFTINFNNWMTVKRVSDANGSFIESISAPINNPTHAVTIKKINSTYYYGEKTNTTNEIWKEIEINTVKGNIQDYGYHIFAQEVFQDYLVQIIDEMTHIEFCEATNDANIVKLQVDENIKLTLHITPRDKKITYMSFEMADALYEISFVEEIVEFEEENSSGTILPNDCLQAQIDFLIKIAEIVGVTQEDLLSIAYGAIE